MLRSRKEILRFVTETLKVPICSIESFGDGIIFSRLLKIVYEDFPIHKIKNRSDNDIKFMNIKIIQTFLHRKGFKAHFSVDKIINGSMQENLDLAQLICNDVKDKMDEANCSFIMNEGSLNNIDVGDISDEKEPTKLLTKKNYDQENREPSNNKHEKENNMSQNNKIMDGDFNEKLSKFLNGLENERNFYYKKCKAIEKLIKNAVIVNQKDIEDILYE